MRVLGLRVSGLHLQIASVPLDLDLFLALKEGLRFRG
jgi:hypothetical protein